MIGALYIHVPFCVRRCAYCAFPTMACSDGALMDSYVGSLELALRRAAKAGLLGGVKTVYIGGGTPSYLGSRRLESLLYTISLSVDVSRVGEFTVEANPDSLSAPMVRDLYALGVDRMSLGVQSFDDDVLGVYGRVHDAARARQAIADVKERFDDFSIDLICGGPGQSMESWEESLEEAVSSGATHVSVYPLMLEEGTPLARSVAEGRLAAPDDDVEADMMLKARDVLEAAGMCRYETASYAYPGHEAKHNCAYWSGVEYLGLGAGASSMLSPEDFAACREVGLFGEARGEDGSPLGGKLPGSCARVRASAAFDPSAFASSTGRAAVDVECLSEREAALEDAMLGMRRSDGISEELVERASRLVPELYGELSRLEDLGLVVHEKGRFAPTERGWLCGNEVFGAIWGLA